MTQSVDDDVSDIVEVDVTAGMSEEERTRARYIHKRRYVSCMIVPNAGPGSVRIGLLGFSFWFR